MEKTRCVFRKFSDGEIIALFPDEPGDNRGNVSSYMHVGQHGAADYTGVVRSTTPATPEEYDSLRLECMNSHNMLTVITPRKATKQYINGRRVPRIRWDLCEFHCKEKDSYQTQIKKDGRIFHRHCARGPINFGHKGNR